MTNINGSEFLEGFANNVVIHNSDYKDWKLEEPVIEFTRQDGMSSGVEEHV